MSHARSGFGRVLGLVALTVVLAGCIGAYQTAPDNPVGAGAVVPAAEDKDAGRVGVVPNFVLTDYPVIAVERFQVARTEIDDEGDQRFADRMAMFFQSELVRRLRDTGLFRRVVNLSETDFPGDAGQALRLRGTITRLGRGSRAVRYLVGFGAGSTRAQAETQFVDARSSRVVLVTADRRLGSMGLFGGDSEDFLKESFDDMARDLAKFLVRLAKGAAPTAGGSHPSSPTPPTIPRAGRSSRSTTPGASLEPGPEPPRFRTIPSYRSRSFSERTAPTKRSPPPAD